MTDYGHDVRLGIFPSPDARDPHRAVELAVVADTSGIDLVSVQDHPYNKDHLDTWTLLTWMAARTTSVRLSPNVANLPLRPPVVLARSVATLDLLSGGRAELGLGAGGFWDAIAAAGGPRRTPGEAVDALVEAIDVLRQVWGSSPDPSRAGSVRVEGEHYRVKGLRAGPAPAHDPQIWIGAYKPRMLRVTGRLADGWLPSMGYLSPDKLPDANAIIDGAAVKAGRRPEDVLRLYNVHAGRGGLTGSPADWAEQLAGLTLEHGMSTFILATDDPDAVRRFGLEVGPALRELVEQERSRAAELTSEQVTLAEVPSEDEMASEQVTPEQVTADQVRDGGGGAAAYPGRGGQQATEGEFTEQQLAAPRHLVEVHDHLRAELAQLRQVVEQVREGHLSVGQARSVINTMSMRQNNWTLGAFCESYCRIVTGHHTLEDRSVFPHLRRAEPEVGPVLDRLQEEHEVIHELLDAVDRALVGLVSVEGYGAEGRDALEDLSGSIEELADNLLAHLSYEEEALFGPLARHGFY